MLFGSNILLIKLVVRLNNSAPDKLQLVAGPIDLMSLD